LVNCIDNQADLVHKEKVIRKVFNSSEFLNPSCNIAIIAVSIELSLKHQISYLALLRNHVAFITQWIRHVSMTLGGILFLGLEVIKTIWVRSN